MFKLADELKPVTLEEASGLSGTKARLLSVGERLFGIHSLNGVSLEHICAEAGQANKFAIQYHFGSKKEFIETILNARIRSLNLRRRELIERANAIDAPTLDHWVEAFSLPTAEQVDEKGRHTYARFILQFILQFENWAGTNPLASPRESMESTNQIMRNIADSLKGVSISRVRSRLLLAHAIMPTALVNFDKPTPARNRVRELEKLVGEMLAMITNALRALEQPRR